MLINNKLIFKFAEVVYLGSLYSVKSFVVLLQVNI